MKKEPLKDKKRFIEFDFDKNTESISKGNAYFMDEDVKSAVEFFKESLHKDDSGKPERKGFVSLEEIDKKLKEAFPDLK